MKDTCACCVYKLKFEMQPSIKPPLLYRNYFGYSHIASSISFHYNCEENHAFLLSVCKKHTANDLNYNNPRFIIDRSSRYEQDKINEIATFL